MTMRKKKQARNISPRPDPNAQEYQQSKKMLLYYQIFIVVGLILFLPVLLFAIMMVKGMDVFLYFILCLVPCVIALLLGSYFKYREVKLRCTIRTTARCIKIVRTRDFTGKHYCFCPVVEFYMGNVRRTAILSEITYPTKEECETHIGETYVIYYDPCDPSNAYIEDVYSSSEKP